MLFPHRHFAHSALATARLSVTDDDVRVTMAHVEELGREMGYLGARVSAVEEKNGEFSKPDANG